MLKDSSVSFLPLVKSQCPNLAGYFHSQMDKAAIPMRSSSDFSDTLAAPLASEIDELADRSESLEQRIVSLNDSYETLKKREVELSEWRWVLREAGGFFDRAHTQTEEIRQSSITTMLLCFATLSNMPPVRTARPTVSRASRR